MTLLDSLRDRVRADPRADLRADPRPETGSDAEVLAAASGFDWWQAPAAGALAAAGSWLVLALPALVVWVATAHTTVGWGDALGIASAGWFLGHGASVAVGELSLSLAPLGLWLLALLLTVRGARRLLDRTERTAPGTTWPRALVRQVVPGFVLGYAGAGLLAWLLTLAGPARPGFAAVLVVLGIPVLALAWALLRRYVADEECGVVGEWLDRLPRWLPRAVRPGVHGVAILLGLGTVLVVIMVAARWSTVSGLHAAVNAGLVGGVVLTAVQLLVLPNLALFALAWLAGPGFQIADGSTINLAGAHPGLMPMIPVLGALPSDGAWSGWLILLLFVPVIAGGLIGWLACRSLARLSSWRTKLATALAAVVTSAAGLTVLAALGSGAVGVDRLSAVGTRPLVFGAALLGLLVAGAALSVLSAQLLLRARPHR
ncbi:MAG TPA: DUF6350 family protein [Lapillicoccus sp.]|uniref:cell division protein PerM n=1 Tax=Lapillicoccus sp. TaxID=1909287 RepID=UPI002F930C51